VKEEKSVQLDTERSVMDPVRKIPPPPKKAPTTASALYCAILQFAHGKRYLMRAPIRMWWNNQWALSHKDDDRVKRRERFHTRLRDLEQSGLIRRFEGGFEIMENIHE